MGGADVLRVVSITGTHNLEKAREGWSGACARLPMRTGVDGCPPVSLRAGTDTSLDGGGRRWRGVVARRRRGGTATGPSESLSLALETTGDETSENDESKLKTVSVSKESDAARVALLSCEARPWPTDGEWKDC